MNNGVRTVAMKCARLQPLKPRHARGDRPIAWSSNPSNARPGRVFTYRPNDSGILSLVKVEKA
jgi:hypothetical protein